MDKEIDFIRLLFPELRFSSDDGLESWRAYVLRERVRAKLQERPAWEMRQIEAWLKVVEEEIAGRRVLATHGAPEYRGKNKIDKRQVDLLRNYYTGDNFVRLFQRVTNFEVIPSHTGDRWRYRCLAHGEDRDPSGVLYLDQGKYWCFSCSSGSDFIGLLTAFPPHLTFTQAIWQLEEWAAPLEYSKKGKKWRVKEAT